MDKEKLFAQIKGGLIVSCQALEHEPLYTKEGGVMPLMAKAAAMSGAVGIRANTVRDITQIKQVVDLPVIGIIKKDYPGTPMYITVTMKEVDELVACGVDILAVQGTGALRPDGSTSAQFIRAIKAKYPEQLVMADCDNFENAMLCAEAGADFVGTTMRGYTPETTGIDDAFPAADAQTEHDEYTPPDSDLTYVSSNSRWRNWADFDRVVHGLFTDAFWAACNDSGSGPIYIEHDGRLFILDCAYGDQYYNGNIPDEFTLAAQTDERIDFTVTAHYSYPYPRQDETQEERDDRLETSYEYTRTYPVTLVNTDAGWRFDAFTTPNQADMRLLGEWDGVEETDFYGET